MIAETPRSRIRQQANTCIVRLSLVFAINSPGFLAMPFDPIAISNSLRKGLGRLQNFDLSAAGGDTLIQQLVRYLQELEKWNQAYNLTAVRDPVDMVPRHLLDALSVNFYLHGKRILDVGTGAGLPGIPLALVNPDKQFTLLDSNGKKIRFVQHAVGVLGLSNVEAVQARIESCDFEKHFDVIVSRAFSTLTDFVNGSGRILGPGGSLLAMKGKLPEAELAALPSGWRAIGVYAIHVPELDAERHAVLLRPTAN
jgi:16S rRNA (guanine527-N7)-methyltransferase